MKKGSKAVRCIICNKVVGYLEPRDINPLGTTGFDLRIFKDCTFGVTHKNHEIKYYCKDCKMKS